MSDTNDTSKTSESENPVSQVGKESPVKKIFIAMSLILLLLLNLLVVGSNTLAAASPNYGEMIGRILGGTFGLILIVVGIMMFKKKFRNRWSLIKILCWTLLLNLLV